MPRLPSLAARRHLLSLHAAALDALQVSAANRTAPSTAITGSGGVAGCSKRLMTKSAAATTSTAPKTTPNRPHPPPTIRGVVFDMDGTLTLPVIDFVEMRRRAGVPPGADILETIEAISDPVARARAHAAVEEVELEGLAGLAPARGLHSVLRRLDALGLPRGLVTRNNRGAVEVFHEKLLLVEEEEGEEGEGEESVVVVVAEEVTTTTTTATGTATTTATGTAAVEGQQQHGRHRHSHHGSHGDGKHHSHNHNHRRSCRRRLAPFHPALARDFKPPKPSPAALLACAEAWGVPASELVMVGDSLADDVVAGNRAGAFTILLDGRGGDHHEVRASFACPETTPTAVATSLEHASELLEQLFDLRPPPPPPPPPPPSGGGERKEVEAKEK